MKGTFLWGKMNKKKLGKYVLQLVGKNGHQEEKERKCKEGLRLQFLRNDHRKSILMVIFRKRPEEGESS